MISHLELILNLVVDRDSLLAISPLTQIGMSFSAKSTQTDWLLMCLHRSSLGLPYSRSLLLSRSTAAHVGLDLELPVPISQGVDLLESKKEELLGFAVLLR